MGRGRVAQQQGWAGDDDRRGNVAGLRGQIYRQQCYITGAAKNMVGLWADVCLDNKRGKFTLLGIITRGSVPRAAQDECLWPAVHPFISNSRTFPYALILLTPF